jgi:hypothetical protein
MATGPGANEALAAERSSIDEIIDLYKKDVDRTLLREALKMSPSERVQRMIDLSLFVEELRASARRTGW